MEDNPFIGRCCAEEPHSHFNPERQVTPSNPKLGWGLLIENFLPYVLSPLSLALATAPGSSIIESDCELVTGPQSAFFLQTFIRHHQKISQNQNQSLSPLSHSVHPVSHHPSIARQDPSPKSPVYSPHNKTLKSTHVSSSNPSLPRSFLPPPLTSLRQTYSAFSLSFSDLSGPTSASRIPHPASPLMSEQSPEIVAAASLSPLSPKPISVQIQSNSVVPMLQDQAATTDTAMSGIIVDPGLETSDVPAPVSDTIVVAGDSSDFHDDSDGSIDYGEEDEAAEKPSATSDGAADALPDNDEYARSFDSPVDPQSSSSEAGAGEPQPDVSEEVAASNSMNDQVTSAPAQAPAPAVIAHHEDRLPPPASSTATQPNVNSWPTLTSIENEPPSQSSGPETSSPSDAPTSTPNNKSAAASAEAADIQKLVDDITARATATATSADTPTSVSAPLISGPLPPSLPPKPLLSAQPHAYQPRGPNPTHNHNHPLGPYRHSLDSMEPPASAPGAAGAGYAASFSNHAWDTFVNDERTYTSEQNWDRFPEGARIFVGMLAPMLLVSIGRLTNVYRQSLQ